jgi:hypothetical protein
MNRSAIRVIGILLLMTAVVVSILNLHRVADLRMPWLAPLFMVWGLAFVILARRRKV